MKKRKKNCWDVKECGRELGGKNVREIGICLAAIYRKLDGVHGGKNAGRACWLVAGTMCPGRVQGTFAEEYKDCLICDFYALVKREEGLDFRTATGLEEMLLDTENRYRMIFERAGDAIFILDTEGEKAGQIVTANQAAAEMHGYTMDELLAMNIRDLDTPDAAREAPARISRMLEGEWIKAEITHRRKDGTIFPVEISAGLLEFGNHKYILAFDRDISERKRLEEGLRALSLTDELTGLTNRRGFFPLAEQQLKLSNRLKRGLYILYIDIDNLKKINDTMGHREGDLVIIETANILKDCFREADVIARISGDEFVVMLVGGTEHDINNVTARLRENLERLNPGRGCGYDLSLSVGTAHYDPVRPSSLDQLLARGDKMMYEDKRLKKKT
ncbi:MAG TPA: diguanylate cyclase [Thermodesulfovibrionales bacterium]|jgi:diguanylate cyclase (GGDEF)-like protein/PAS domain S-box-containing protein|nr:diguanylate cyclase [Thermodesulfovibrionales bacterium]